MKTQVLKIAVLSIIIFGFTLTSNAQVKGKKKMSNLNRINTSSTTATSSSPSNTTTFEGCNRKLASKTGEVFSVAPGVISARATSNQVTVSVKKTGGRAETQVNIYVNGNIKQRHKMEFDNNAPNRPRYTNRVLNGVKGKMIKIEIVNQSVGNTFQYKAKIVGKQKSAILNGRTATGNLIGQGFKNVFTEASCTGKTKVIVSRTGGKARTTIRIFEQNSAGNYSNTSRLESVTFEKNETKREFIMNSNKKLKIELKNVSVGKTIKYKITAESIE